MADSNMIQWEVGPDGKHRPVKPAVMGRLMYDAYCAQVYPEVPPTFEEYLARLQPKEED